MSELYDLGTPDRIVVGVIGEPGQRIFYLQARSGESLITMKLEKQQVAALCEHLGGMLQDLPRPGELEDASRLDLEPFPAETFIVGDISLSYDSSLDRVMVLIESRVSEEETPDEARILMTREQTAALAIKGVSLVESGRPPCPLCGFPLDPRGHVCPRTNGHQPPTR